MGIVTIVIDAGHGGWDSGAVGGGLMEKTLTLKISLKIKQFLTSLYEDVNILLTRSADVALKSSKNDDLKTRAVLANNAKAKLFVSIHINAGGEGTGFESFVYNGASAQSRAYQNVIHKKAAVCFTKRNFRDRGQKTGNLSVLRNTNMPAILMEYGFLNSAKDVALLKDENFLNEIALATAQGIAESLGLKAKPVVASAEEEKEMKIDAVINGVTVKDAAILSEGRTFLQVSDIKNKRVVVEKWDNVNKVLHVRTED